MQRRTVRPTRAAKDLDELNTVYIALPHDLAILEPRTETIRGFDAMATQVIVA